MDMVELRKYVRTLATLEETEAPVLSCYLTLDGNLGKAKEFLDRRLSLIRDSLPGAQAAVVNQAVRMIEEFMLHTPLTGCRGVALFARGGGSPFFLPLVFNVPVPNWVSADHTPNIYHLVELKDDFDRYVILLCTPESARILEVTLGSVTRELWERVPETRGRVGREWTKEHYYRRRKAQTERFLKEKIELLEKLMREGGHRHLILAGDPRLVAAVRDRLPKALTEKLVDVVYASGRDRPDDVVAAALRSFLDYEEHHSQAVADRLVQAVHTDGLGVVGMAPTLEALQLGRVDTLVLSKRLGEQKGWMGLSSGWIAVTVDQLKQRFPAAEELRQVNLREEMVRLAGQGEANVEVVGDNPRLDLLGGVGALVRFRA